MTTIQPRTATVTIYQGDYLDRIRHLEARHAAAVEAEKKTSQTLDEVPESHLIAEEHTALKAEAEETALHVVVQALGRKTWKALVAEHPPREGNEADKSIGANEETFKEALVTCQGKTKSGREYKTILEPQLSEEDLDQLADIDFDRIYYTAFALNRAPVTGPKASLVSRTSQPKDETSN